MRTARLLPHRRHATGEGAGRNPSFRMENAFAEGHAIGRKYTDWLWEMGALVGDWHCRECGHQWFAKAPKECQFCRSERLTLQGVHAAA